MDMHHCPRCELRFVNTSELRQHFATDHGGDAGTFERFRYHAGPSVVRDVHTVLLVGNETLARDEVVAEAVTRAGPGGRVLVLVPLHHEGDGGEAGIARWRLAGALERLRAAGLAADGEVGDADPFHAVTHLLAREHVDEIVVSTLPESTSHWLGVDLPGRLRRHTHRPVDVLTPVATEHG